MGVATERERADRLRAWRYYAGLHRGNGRAVALALAALLGQTAALLAIPAVVSAMFDGLGPVASATGKTGAASPPPLLTLLGYGAAVVALYVLNALLNTAGRRRLFDVTTDVTEKLRRDIVAKVFSLSVVAWEEADRALLETSLVQDAERIDSMSVAGLATGMPAAVSSVVLGLALLWIEPVLLGVMLLAGPLLLLADRGMGAEVGRRAGEYRASVAALAHRFTGALRRLPVLRAEAVEHVEAKVAAGLAAEVRRRRLHLADAGLVYGVVQNTVVHAASAVVLLVGGVSVAAGSLSLGTLVAFYIGLMLLKNYVTAVMLCAPVVLEGEAALRGVVAVLDLDAKEPYTGRGRISFRGGLRLEGIRYAYGGHVVLDGVDLELAAGTTTAIVGPNGAGKSTLASIVLGLLRPDEGVVTADGVALDELDVRALRSSIGVVPQEPMLPEARLVDCLTFGRSDASREDLLEALRVSTADSIVAALPAGLDTDLGEEAHRLSGGERQRLALARALVHRPVLLVLDEPTSHLDAESVSRLLANLAALEPRPAVLLITHDRGVLAACDRVYELRVLAEARRRGEAQVVELPRSQAAPAATTPGDGLVRGRVVVLDEASRERHGRG